MTTVPATIREQIALPAERGDGGGVSLTAADFAAILKSRLVMIIALWLLFSAIGVGLFFLVYFKYPTYRASAYIACISDLPIRAGEFAPDMLTEDRYERFIASQAMNAVSAEVLSAVLQTPEVRSTNWFANADKPKLRL